MAHPRFPPDLWSPLVSQLGHAELAALSGTCAAWREFVCGAVDGAPAPRRRWSELAARRWRHGAPILANPPPPAPFAYSAEFLLYRARHLADRRALAELRAIVNAPTQDRTRRIGEFAAEFGLDAFDALLAAIKGSYGHPHLQLLREAAETALGSIRRGWVIRQLRTVRRHAEIRAAGGDVAEEPVPLLLAASLFTLFAHPHVDYQQDIESKIEAFAANARDLPLPPDATPVARAEAIASYLAETERFQGAESVGFYTAKNSMLDRVVADRTGIPITLGLVFKVVADRCGVPIDMISSPGHMLTKLASQPAEDGLPDPPSDDDVFVDMYRGGALLSRADVRAMLAAQPLMGVDLDDYLRPATDIEVLVRMARNILNVERRDAFATPQSNAIQVGALWAFVLLSGSRHIQGRAQLYRAVESSMPCDLRLLEEDVAELLARGVPEMDLAPLQYVLERMRNSPQAID
ncbi:Transglutaminase-like superfamily-domain-containing protein [Hyaloraphidium curvatum]|nr:Transglutaminase-like superfamily-domain-containing protein [Hyaloraphidium curvatum]